MFQVPEGSKTCGECDFDKSVEWLCLQCNIHLHDFCIDKHKNSTDGASHCVIPEVDLFNNSTISDGKPQKPRVEKIVVTGPGIEPEGIIGEFDSHFTVETYGAGFGQLDVKIKGPKDGFTVKLDHHKESKTGVMCSYKAMHAGKYTITITWSKLEVPGSPFIVVLKDKEKA